MKPTPAIITAAQTLEHGVWQAFLEKAPFPMVLVEGPDHLVRSVNPSFCQLLDKAPEELVGKPFRDVFPQRALEMTLLDRILRTGLGEANVALNGDPLKALYGGLSCWPIPAAQGRLGGLMIQVREIDVLHKQSVAINEALMISSVQQHELTDVADQLNVRLTREIAEREQAQELLRKNHDSFFNLVEHAPFGIYVVDAHFRLRQMNSAALKVFEHVEHPLDRNFEEVLKAVWPDPFASKAIGRFRRTLETGEPHSSLITEYRHDIQAIESYDWKIERINLPDGGNGVVCYFYDVSDRMKAEEMLRDADRRKSEFLATLAHELRNPLAPMRSGLELLALTDHDHSIRDEAYGMMQRQMDQMVRLIDDLMDLSRITRGVVDLRMERVDLRTIIDRAVETCRPLIQLQDHTLVLDMPDEPVMVDGDGARLTQVFSNLLNNAAKYTDRGGSIAMRLDRGTENVAVTVEDNGIGIAPDQLGKVFDMFAQVERTNERVQGGLGIGLNIVKHLVSMHGGRITARSDGLGHGSSFTVQLPLPKRAQQQVVASPEAAPVALTPRRILVVDDNEDAALMQALLLGRQGHDVRVAHNGEQALEQGAQFTPDVVLMDLGMPVMDGYAACRMMRRTAWGANALIVALSGWGQDEDRVKSREAGFDHHLVKPIASEVLVSTIRAARGL